MFTKEEIKELKKEFEEGRIRYDKSSKELQNLSEKLNGKITEELKNKDKEHRGLFEEMLKNKKNYNDACVSNFCKKYSKIEDEIEKGIIKKEFEHKTQKADFENYGDWDDIMEELELW